MNQALTLRAVMKAAVMLGVVSACVSACGFKGPLVMPPAQSVEPSKIGGSTAIVSTDASGMGVKK